MRDVIIYAIPVFVVLLILEALSYYLLPDEDKAGYEAKDTRTSLIMGAGYVVVNIGWKFIVLMALTALYLIAPVHVSATNPWTWVALVAPDREKAA